MKNSILLLAFLPFASAAQVVGSSVSPTGEITQAPRGLRDAGISASKGNDSIGVGNNWGGLVNSSLSIDVCTLNNTQAGCPGFCDANPTASVCVQPQPISNPPSPTAPSSPIDSSPKIEKIKEHGSTFYASAYARGTASIAFQTMPNGTYKIVSTATNSRDAGTLATGTWLPNGHSASDYAVKYDVVSESSDSEGSGSNSVINDAAAIKDISAMRAITSKSVATRTKSFAESSIEIQITYLKSGSVVSENIVRFITFADGN